MKYDFKAIENIWRNRWESERTYTPDLEQAAKPFYNLMMFPYPSAEGLHVGNVFSFVGADIQGRYYRACGYDVFEPMGFDAFGMHSENFALKTETHPSDQTAASVANFRDQQLKRIGNMFDWSHEINTTDATYYRWTQWIFLQLFKYGLAYQASAPVNWCPSCATVLADEQAAGGTCERCDTPVMQKEMKQWFLRITAYAERLHTHLDALDWSDSTKATQKRWIGRSEGADVVFDMVGDDGSLTVFTTRPDTLWGVTFLVVSPNSNIAPAKECLEPVAAYRQSAFRMQLRETPKDKTGVFTGRYAVHPCTGKHIPIWMSDYVVEGYGTGAIMGVPAHDGRDLEFATAYGLPIVTAIDENNRLVNSGPFDGMTTQNAQTKITAWLENVNKGEPKVRYRLHDWCISRQRYWGTPIPIIHCDNCGALPVDEQHLPVILPYIKDYQPDGSGHSPLARNPDFTSTMCPTCGAKARRETDVCDNFLDSSWYFLRYPSTDSDDKPFDQERLGKWLPVDMYVGGNEHAVLHLMYSRFVAMALFDAGITNFEEPFTRFRANGMIVKDGAKMSKSKGNVVVPDKYLDEYGADVLRTYLMFSGNFAEGSDFRDANIVGIKRFIERFWTYYQSTSWDKRAISENVRREIHKRIKRITRDIEKLEYNTAIASIMELLRIFERNSIANRHYGENLLTLFSPFAPFVCHEAWDQMGASGAPDTVGWPSYIEELTVDEIAHIAIQINGKLKGAIQIARGAGKEKAIARARATPKVEKILASHEPRRVIYIPDKLVNFVI